MMLLALAPRQLASPFRLPAYVADCNRISGLDLERSVLRAMKDFAHWEPIVAAASLATLVAGFAQRRSDRYAFTSIVCGLAWVGSSSLVGQRQRVRLTSHRDRPGGSRELVRDGDRCLVVA
jgi:hypothetical protein